MQPVVSVIVPCYNQGHFLGDAIESALSQTWQPTEVVVVDDGSTDNTAVVAARYPGVRCVSQANSGLAAARNAGFQVSSGEYIAFLDADDRLVPDGVETGTRYLERHPEWAFVSGAHRLIGVDGTILLEWEREPVGPDGFIELLRRNYIGVPAAVLLRREAFAQAGGFDERFGASSDRELYLRIARQHAVGTHDTIVAEYRKYGGAMSDDACRMLKSSLAVLKAQERYGRGNSAVREALREGRRFLRAHYGARAATAVRLEFAVPGRRLHALLTAFRLAQRAPMQALGAVLPSRQT